MPGWSTAATAAVAASMSISSAPPTNTGCARRRTSAST
jgi:hypothetical protein